MGERIGQINKDGREFELNTDNVSLFQHVERYAMYDHAYIRLPEDFDDSGETKAMYVWKTLGHTALFYTLLEDALKDIPDAERHLNMRSAVKADTE